MDAKLVVILAINGIMFILASIVEFNYYATHEHQVPHHFSASLYSGSTDFKHSGQLQTVTAATNTEGFITRASTLSGQSGATGFSPKDGSAGDWRNPAVILFAFNRTDYLEQTLQSLAGLDGLEQTSVYISQDGNYQKVADLVERFRQRLSPPHSRGFAFWQRERIAQLRPNQAGHAWLSQHYKWGLDRVFLERAHSHAIVVEDDMLFSPDFLTFFRATADLLARDPSLWCISTWNDNGLASFDWDNRRMLRTSYFPGLGWMMRRELWLELGPHWPLQSWDHWMRLNSTSHGRECIAPEVNRNFNIGEKGANMDRRVFQKYLSVMSWNQAQVDDYGDLSYLVQPAYSQHLQHLVQQAEHWPWQQQSVDAAASGKVFLLTYKSEEYPELAKRFKIWPFPRAHHKHVAVIPYRNSTFLLADVRFSPLLPTSLRLRPSVNLSAVAGQREEACGSVCEKQGMRCHEQDFWFINSCETLMQHFPCERGCSVELGADIPNYVMDPELNTFQSCLVSQVQPHCNAWHAATARLCPCSPLNTS